jgi:hypothetical protein
MPTREQDRRTKARLRPTNCICNQLGIFRVLVSSLSFTKEMIGGEDVDGNDLMQALALRTGVGDTNTDMLFIFCGFFYQPSLTGLKMDGRHVHIDPLYPVSLVRFNIEHSLDSSRPVWRGCFPANIRQRQMFQPVSRSLGCVGHESPEFG